MGCPYFSRRKLVLTNRNIFTAIPFIAAGFGGEEAIRAFSESDPLRIFSSLSVITQGIIAVFIFLKNRIAGRSWKFRSSVIFLVGLITGLIGGLVISYPLMYDLDKLPASRSFVNPSFPVSPDSSINLTLTTINVNDSLDHPHSPQQQNVSKLEFLIPTLLLSIFMLLNTIYGLSISVESSQKSESQQSNADKEEEFAELRSE